MPHASQHNIDHRHLASKGIFAALCVRNNQFAFIDPARFAALLGATTDQGVILPRNIRDAFHQLGNSISVVHSILGVSIALSVLGISKQPIMHSVVKCWENRIAAHKVITLCESDFLHFVACEHVEDTVCQLINPDEPSEDSIPIHIREKCLHVGKNVTIEDFLNAIGIPSAFEQGILLKNDELNYQCNEVIERCQGLSFECFKGEIGFFRFRVGHANIESTIPWTPHELVDDDHDEIDNQLLREAVVHAESRHDHIEEHFTEQVAVFSVGVAESTSFVSIKVPINIDYDETCQWISCALGCDKNEVVWYETEHFRKQNHQRCVIATSKSVQPDDYKLVIVQIQNEQPFVCKVPSPISPMQIPGFEDVNAIVHNGKPVGSSSIVSIEHGDDFYCPNAAKRRKIQQLSDCSQKSFHNRIELLSNHKNKLGTDEYSILQRIINESNKNIECSNVWDCSSAIPSDLFLRVDRFMFSDQPGATLACPILWNDHWAAFELSKTANGVRITFCNVPETLLNRIQLELICKFNGILKHVSCQTIVIPALEGFCGWALLYRWFRNFQVQFPNDDLTKCSALTYAAIHNSIAGKQHWGNVSSFALQARLVCFQRISASCPDIQSIRFGATGNEQTPPDASMTDSAAVKTADPWLKFDPWQKGQKQCKWEDLTLPKDHPIHDFHNNRLQQIHRHQLNQNVGGVAFCTKANVNDILAKKPKQPFALILPASDKLHFDESLKLKIIPSSEIVVEDGATGAVYKRQIAIAYQGEDIRFELPKPSYKGTLTEKSEIVLEVHSSLVSRDLLNAFRDKPQDTIKAKVIEQFPAKTTDHINIYSVRKIPDANDPDKFRIQAMCKVDKSNRGTFLEASGAGDIIARDFIPKGEVISDITVIPRFWPIDKNGKAEALRSAGSTDGFAGIIATKRGLAIRACSAKVAQLRKVLMSQDERINSENISIVPTISYDSTGWPASASPNEIVHAVSHSCGTPPIPSRCFRALGVVTWTLVLLLNPKSRNFR